LTALLNWPARNLMQSGRDLALVTGASSGIGAEIARQLAGRRIDLVLTARRRERLEALAAELSERHGVKVAVIENDLNTEDGADHLVEELAARELRPTVLVNNAGFGCFSEFLEQPRDDIEALLEVNIRAVTILCRRLGERMAAARHGYILNVSSFAAIAPIPRYAVYSGAKAYVIGLSQALRHELARRGVKVSVLCPGFTRTEFHDVSGHEKSRLMRATELSVEQVARAGLAGLARGKFLIVPGWWYKLNTVFARLLPRSLMSSLSARVVK
jgi:short-subunit dehydrogenase